MSTPIAFGEKPCRFFWFIGSGVCDNCGERSEDHDGMATPVKNTHPFGERAEYVGLTWPEWNQHCDAAKRATAARRALADLSDDEAVRLAAEVSS